MTRFAFRLLTTFALLAFAVPAGATKYAGEFMKIPVGARAIGMGGAFSAVSDDATSPYWNPAGMVYLPYREAFLGFGRAVAGTGADRRQKTSLCVHAIRSHSRAKLDSVAGFAGRSRDVFRHDSHTERVARRHERR